MAGIWGLLAIPVFIIVLFSIMMDKNFSFAKIGMTFWIICSIMLAIGFFGGYTVLIYLSFIIFVLRASGKLGE